MATVALLGMGLLVALRWAGWVIPSAPLRPPVGMYVEDVVAQRATVWALGDGADGSAASRALARRILAEGADRLLYLGDVYGSHSLLGRLLRDGSFEDFAARYDPAYRPLADRTAPTPGNHEWARRAEGYRPYWARVNGRPPPDYYEFRAAGWQILALNSQAPHDAGSAQVRWLHERLRGGGTCRIAFWHRPRYSAGRHGDQPDLAPLWDALAGRAKLVLSGHDHDLQAFRPVGGVTQLVDGAGGADRYQVRDDARLSFADDRTTGAIRLQLRRGEVKWAFVRADGHVLRAGRSTCE